jgi:hypothetical protein
VEKVDLGWIQTSWTSNYSVVNWGKGSDSGFSGDFVGFNFLFKSEDWGITENECNFILEDWGEDLEFRNFSSVLLEVFELLTLNAFNSEFDDFLDQSVFGDDKGTIEGSECFSDLLNLIRSNVGEISKDDLLMISEEFIKFFDLRELFSSNLSSTSHL